MELVYVIGNERNHIAHQLSELLLKGFVQGMLTKALSVGQTLIEMGIRDSEPIAEWSDFLMMVFERLAFSVRQQSEAGALVIIIRTVGHVDAAMIAKLARARMGHASMVTSSGRKYIRKRNAAVAMRFVAYASAGG